jgi:hypothetical protein
MCLSILFRKKFTLTHPEEQQNYAQTIDNIDLPSVLTKWLTNWEVPAQWHDFWRGQIIIEVTVGIEYPAGTWSGNDGKRYMNIRPEWLNPGVIAHEQAHNSYALLTEEQKSQFTVLFDTIKNSNTKLIHLWKINNYGLTSDIEGHAEVYRYWGQDMPAEMKLFYPRLF